MSGGEYPVGRAQCSIGIGLPAAHYPLPVMRSTDITIADVSYDYEGYRYRSPIKFGGMVLDRVTILNVRLTAETRSGKVAAGFGSMPLGNVWAFPSRKLSYDDTLGAMKELAAAFWETVEEFTDSGHPVELGHELERRFLAHLDPLSRELNLVERIPVLAGMVVGSAFDAAIHDAFGKVHGLNCYHTYGPEFLEHDLGRYLGPEFAGE